MKNLILIFLLVNVRETNGQTYVLIPDASFVSYLQNIIPTAMQGNSLNVTSTLVTTSTQMIDVHASNISNLNGIQYFTSLTYLICYNNSLTNLPALPNTLTYLDCGYNPITNLPSLPSSLQSLYCISNSLTSLPILPSTLSNLNCNHNNIVCFLAFPQSLIGVDLGNNPFTCLPNYVLPAMNSYTNVPLCMAGNSNGCMPAAVEEFNLSNSEITVYPNPNCGQFKIKIDYEIHGEIVLINSLGQKVYEQKILPGENEIIVNKLSNGLYLYFILQNEQQISNGKIIIE